MLSCPYNKLITNHFTLFSSTLHVIKQQYLKPIKKEKLDDLLSIGEAQENKV